MKNVYRIVILMVAVLPLGELYGQQQLTVSGKVTVESGEGLPGANVLLKSTLAGTVTDVDGNYLLEIRDPTGALVFSFIGYVTLEVPVQNRSLIDVNLATDVTSLDEVVVIGYGEQSRATITTSISKVTESEFQIKHNSMALAEGIAVACAVRVDHVIII